MRSNKALSAWPVRLKALWSVIASVDLTWLRVPGSTRQTRGRLRRARDLVAMRVHALCICHVVTTLQAALIAAGSVRRHRGPTEGADGTADSGTSSAAHRGAQAGAERCGDSGDAEFFKVRHGC